MTIEGNCKIIFSKVRKVTTFPRSQWKEVLIMEALRFRAKPVKRRITIELPPHMDADTVEVIILCAKRTSSKKGKCRQPPIELSGTVIYDDLITPAAPESDWVALQ